MKITRGKKRPYLSKTPNTIRTVCDDFGNCIKAIDNGRRIVVHLSLADKQHDSRRLGVINPAQKTIHIQRIRSKHLMQKFDAYGFNHKLIADSKKFDIVRLSDEHCDWKIPKSFILENGKFLNFKQQGFELQIFVTLSELEQFKTTAII